MSNWITDRLPTIDDAVGFKVLKWHHVAVLTWEYDAIKLGEPWQPITKPTPYVNPSRWRVVPFYTSYMVVDDNISYSLPDPCTKAQAERICKAFNEVMP
jgi:hypothetical protein